MISRGAQARVLFWSLGKGVGRLPSFVYLIATNDLLYKKSIYLSLSIYLSIYPLLVGSLVFPFIFSDFEEKRAFD